MSNDPVETRIAEIHTLMGDSSSVYYKGEQAPVMQKEYRDLVDQRDEAKRAASAGKESGNPPAAIGSNSYFTDQAVTAMMTDLHRELVSSGILTEDQIARMRPILARYNRDLQPLMRARFAGDQ